MVRLRGRIACRFGCMVGAWIHRYWFADRRDGCWSCKIAGRRHLQHQEMEAIAMITQAGLTALGAGNLEAVGIAMDACHEKLQNIGVSSPELDSLVEAVRPHSLGAKLTGSWWRWVYGSPYAAPTKGCQKPSKSLVEHH